MDGDRYLTDHPSAETTVIQCASKGLAKTAKGDKALDQIRVELGTRPENWKKFKNVVDKFLGDRFKDEFDQKMMNDPIPILTSEILGMRKQISVENINKVTNLKTKINQYPNLKLNSGKKVEKKQSKKLIKKTGKGKPIPFTCGWCGRNHHTVTCSCKNASKWKSHVCTNCKGTGHPKTVCPTPKIEFEEEVDVGAVFFSRNGRSEFRN